MSVENNLYQLIKEMSPELNDGEFVFTTINSFDKIDRDITLFEFKEKEGITLVLKRDIADGLNLSYNYIASWITLKVHSSLDAVGLTAAFSNELSKYNISCNVVAGFYHDHIFVDKNDGEKAVKVLLEMSKNHF
ncbi:hypothetical protein SAMN05428642_102730 [Flaviramulus basaltis]|uniref:Uncharacterized protein n=1 Tax=Flaviramulus basaltis TaxID=369401 RepID=A0A1K2IJ46_9FLAO|nr:ACT domain-containing protein [Flaviramulus basaltis]SFZ92444.1 hypothetical protein SAMN05428642_102730 [Flaviramulus basaltis]